MGAELDDVPSGTGFDPFRHYNTKCENICNIGHAKADLLLYQVNIEYTSVMALVPKNSGFIAVDSIVFVDDDGGWEDGWP